jgi:phosphoglycolate phosphatase-like HAD superfamily hydrolase
MLPPAASAPQPASTLVLFDIDGTLLDVRGAGRRAFADALRETFGVEDDLHHIRFAGATDRGVLRQLRERHGLALQDEPAFFRAMERTLSAALIGEPPHVYEGVHACLARLSSSKDVVLGLVTGNALGCAHVKLERAGLDRSIFDVGGYGDEHEDRDVLARLAKERAERARGHTFTRVVLVGDTPSDVRAAHAVRGVAVAVTTGHYDRQALVDAGADVVVDDLASFTFVTGELPWPTT